MKRISIFTRLSSLVAALAVAAVSAPADGEPMQIASAADWAQFAKRVRDGETSLCAIMTADVSLDNDAPSVGDQNSWSGTFNGNGHTLTLDWTRTEGYTAPFRYAAGCTIENLHVTGVIRSSSSRTAGFIAQPQPGNTTLRNCRSSVTIESSFDGSANSGGFIGYTYWSSFRIYFYDCLFDGSLLGPLSTRCGGFLGFNSADPYVRFTNCLFDPKTITMSESGFDTFGPSYNPNHLEYNNAYYTRIFGSVSTTPTNASSMSAEELAAALGPKWTVVDGKATLKSFADARDSSAAASSFVYHGALRDAQGHALAQRSHNVEFRLYDQATGGSPLWGQSHAVTLDEAGVFSIALGDGRGDAIDGVASNGLASIIAANAHKTLYIGLAVDGGAVEISPRPRLLAAPRASWAANADTASGDMAAAGKASASGLTVSGTTSAASATAAGAVSAGTLSVAGRATVAGDLSVAGVVNGDGVIPVGGIVAWSGERTDIPAGWALCNGQTVGGRKTPDLRNRFVVGAGDEYKVGNTGGEKMHRLTKAEMPSHSHSFQFKGADLDLSWDNDNYFFDASGHYDNNSNSKDTDSAGGGQPHENRPPFYALCYIMRVR